MDYQNYEDYMREVLGYQNMPNNNVYNTYYTEYETPVYNMEIEELNNMYPDIYKFLYPMVCKVCNQNSHKRITREVLEEMVSEIYNSMEAKEMQPRELKPLRNGDVTNPNTRKPEMNRETRQRNYYLEDLIRILLLRELIRPGRSPYMPNRPGYFPGMPPYPHHRLY